MRVIRTEMYFDPGVVHYGTKKHEKNPGVTAAWFGAADAEPPSIDDLDSILDKNHTTVIPKDIFGALQVFADIAVQNVSSSDSDDALLKQHWEIANKDIVRFVLESEIILESSPPYTIPLSKIGKGGAAVVIGSFLGWGIADGDYPLMFLMIPFGIIVIGSAIGISRGLENGLNHFIEGLFKKKHKQPKKTK